MGGDSILSIQFVSRARKAGFGFSARDIFRYPTVEALARAGNLDHEDASHRLSLNILLPLRSNGNLAPLFCVHPAGGLSWCYSRLMRYLKPDRPMYGLQARSLIHGETIPQSIDEMATDYVEQIHKIQPNGPYHLLGWSFGALVVHTMATRMRSAGASIPLVAVVDPPPPSACSSSLVDTQELLRAFMQEMGLESGDQKLDVLTTLNLLRRADHEYGTLEDQQFLALLHTYKHNVKLSGTFVLRRLEEDIVYFYGFIDERDLRERLECWRPYVGGQIKTHYLAAEHKDMLKKPEALEVIGRILRAELS